MRNVKQKHVTDKIINNYLASSSFFEEETKEILVSSIGASDYFNSFLKEFISGFKMKGFRILIVSVGLEKDNQICLTIDNGKASSEVYDSSNKYKFFLDFKKSYKLLQALPTTIKDSYDAIIYIFDKNNPFITCPSILNYIKNLVVFINKKNTSYYDLIEIEEVLSDKKSLNSAFVISKK